MGHIPGIQWWTFRPERIALDASWLALTPAGHGVLFEDFVEGVAISGPCHRPWGKSAGMDDTATYDIDGVQEG